MLPDEADVLGGFGVTLRPVEWAAPAGARVRGGAFTMLLDRVCRIAVPTGPMWNAEGLLPSLPAAPVDAVVAGGCEAFGGGNEATGWVVGAALAAPAAGGGGGEDEDASVGTEGAGSISTVSNPSPKATRAAVGDVGDVGIMACKIKVAVMGPGMAMGDSTVCSSAYWRMRKEGKRVLRDCVCASALLSLFIK